MTNHSEVSFALLNSLSIKRKKENDLFFLSTPHYNSFSFSSEQEWVKKTEGVSWFDSFSWTFKKKLGGKRSVNTKGKVKRAIPTLKLCLQIKILSHLNGCNNKITALYSINSSILDLIIQKLKTTSCLGYFWFCLEQAMNYKLPNRY